MKTLLAAACIILAVPAFAAETEQERAAKHFQIAEAQVRDAGKRCFGPDYSLEADGNFYEFSKFEKSAKGSSNECRDYTAALDAWIELNMAP